MKKTVKKLFATFCCAILAVNSIVVNAATSAEKAGNTDGGTYGIKIGCKAMINGDDGYLFWKDKVTAETKCDRELKTYVKATIKYLQNGETASKSDVKEGVSKKQVVKVTAKNKTATKASPTYNLHI